MGKFEFSMKETSNQTISGIGVLSALGILFVGLRLANIITWPWVWVLCPFWIPFSVFLVILVIAFIIYCFKP